jgi:hypothetical protein
VGKIKAVLVVENEIVVRRAIGLTQHVLLVLGD